MKNKKGFTMIELLAVIVIIGIVATLGVVGVTRLIKSSHTKYNNAQLNLFVTAGQNYFTDNKSKLPTKTFTSKEVTLKTLKDKNFIDKIVDYKKEEYDENKSRVFVTRMAVGKYVYSAELLTKDGTSTINESETNKNSSATFEIGTKSFNKTDPDEYSNGDEKIKIYIEDKDKIAGYIISIYKDNKKLKELEYNEIGDLTQVDTTIDLNAHDYPDGKYHLKVKVIDIYNNQQTFDSGNIIMDTRPPKCSITLTGTKGKNQWYTSNVNVGLNIIDETNLSQYSLGIKQEPNWLNIKKNISITQKETSSVTYYGYVKDKAGNESSCGVISFGVNTCTSVYYKDGTSCSKKCGGGTFNQLAYSKIDSSYRCSKKDKSSGGSQCNTQDCCSSIDLKQGSCSKKCGGGQYNLEAYSKFNGQRCKQQDVKNKGGQCNTQDCCAKTEKCSVKCGGGTAISAYDKKTKCECEGTNCKKSSCKYVGNTKYNTDVHWPYNLYHIGNGDCPSKQSGFWFYCTDDNGKLWTHLRRNAKFLGTAQWACPSNKDKIKKAGVGGTVTISGKNYTVIDDSNGGWKRYTNKCYYDKSNPCK